MEFPTNRTRKIITEGSCAYGMFAGLGEPALVEMMGYAGLDFVVIDTEHSGNTMEQVYALTRAAEVSGITPIMRVTENSPGMILRALDAGAAGVLVPQVNSAEEAAAVVRAARYAPQGERGLAGVVRAARYGFIPLPTYLAGANRENLVITQVEHIDAVNNLDEILAVEGLDGIFVGPTDLSQSMGITGKFADPELRRVIHAVIEKTRRTDKWAGIFCLDAEDAAYWKAAGAQFLTIAMDSMIFASGMRRLVKQIHGE